MTKINKTQIDKYEIARLFNQFFGWHSISIHVGNFEVHAEDGGIEEVAKHFAEYTYSYQDGSPAPSPFDELREISELFDLARRNGNVDPAFFVFETTPREKLDRCHQLLEVAKEKYEDIVGVGEIETIENYLYQLERDAHEAQRSQEIQRAIAAHYDQRRAESLAVISAPKLRTLIMERDGAKCRWCGETEGLALDHILPVSAGGTDDPENLQLLCGSCNSSKGDRVPSQFKDRTEA